ncbi:MAG: LbtU family siderophore porin [Desulfobacterales bacterium]|nr:LbtU family siderophore porin [Desulfobacterales bacterium]
MYRRKVIIIGITLFSVLFIINSNAFAISQETEKLLNLLEKKKIITDKEAADMKQEMESSSQAGDNEAYETKLASLLGKWADKIHPSACIEVEAFYQDYNFHDPSVRDTDTSDLKLATVAFGFDVDIAKHVKGSLFFLYEEDDTEPFDIDEGIITIDGEDIVPLVVHLGKMYVPFGRFKSYFIRDPLTLELGETNESAVIGCFSNNRLALSVGTFNGDVDETGEASFNHIDNYLASACFTLPEKTVPDLNLTAGISGISNIADSNNLQTVGTGVSAATIKNHIGGFNAFIIASLLDRYFFNAEYLGAIDDFEAGELSFDGGKAYRPEVWTIEFAYGLTDRLNLAVCYEGSNDCGDFLPKKQFGGGVSYCLFKNTSVALEYLYGKYENKYTRHLMTTQLAIGF